MSKPKGEGQNKRHSKVILQVNLEKLDKYLKGSFKLMKDLSGLNPSIHTIVHLFDDTITPIALSLYGSEIWGILNGILAPLSHHIQIPISSSLVFKRIGQVCVVVDNIPLYI